MLVNNNNYSPSFEAVKIKLKGAKRHSEYNLVELNVHNIFDIMALDKADKVWLAERNALGNQSCHYLNDILTSAVRKRNPDKFDKNKYDNIQIFALTKQRFFFHRLNHEKIVAAARMRIKDTETPRLDVIEVRPVYQYANKERTIKGIGTYFLNCLKIIVKGKRISIFPDDFSPKFYKKYGAYPDEQFPDMKCYI